MNTTPHREVQEEENVDRGGKESKQGWGGNNWNALNMHMRLPKNKLNTERNAFSLKQKTKNSNQKPRPKDLTESSTHFMMSVSLLVYS